MKKQLLTLVTVLAASVASFAQTVINDSVTLGSGYANQVWYSLKNDEQGMQPKNNWDIAFNLKDITAPLMINSASGVMLWGYPKATAAGWTGSVDTTGLSTWMARYNSDTSWSLGAMGNYADPNNGFDLDWGIYDLGTHQILADSFYIIKTVNGAYKKLMIQSLISGTFSFKYADLDGSNEQTATVKKADYAGKNYVYYSLQNSTVADREPLSANWDLTFTQYTGFVPIAYTVTGVLHNRDVTVAQVGGLGDKNTYTSYGAHAFESAINVIGYDWKNNAGVVKDSLVYFVQTAEGAVWKVIFTKFTSGMTGSGTMSFSKQELLSAGIENAMHENVASLTVSPNPSMGGNVSVVYSLKNKNNKAMLHVYDMTGRTVHTQNLNTEAGFYQYQLPAALLQSGAYIVLLQTDNGSAQQRLIVQ